MGRFVGKLDLQSFPNAAKKGIKLFSRAEIAGVKGYESLYRAFWNKKAEELCGNPSFKKWSKTAIAGVIATEWTLKKTALLGFNHAERLIRQEESHGEKRKRSQTRDTVHLSMIHAHKSLLRLDERLRRSLKCPTNTTKDKKRKLQVLEDNISGRPK